MSYIDRHLMEGEDVLFQTRPHWIVFRQFALWLILALLMFTVVSQFAIGQFSIGQNITLATLVGLLFLIVAIYYGITSLIIYTTSEYGITNKRVIMKIGFIRRTSLEILLAKIESIHVSQSIVGRFLNYGSITVSGTGGSKDPFHYIPKPLDFRTKVQQQLELYHREQ